MLLHGVERVKQKKVVKKGGTGEEEVKRGR